CMHAAWQVPALMSASLVHDTPSSHEAGHLPVPFAMPVSQVSPASTTPLPHDAEQSLSVLWLAPAGQQPSPSCTSVIGVWRHAVVHAEPDSTSTVQPTASS